MTRAQGGRTARDVGAAFEAAIEQRHALYRRRGIYVEHAHPSAKIVRVGGEKVVVFDADGPPDYHAFHPSIGFVVFDAKATTQPRWRLANVSAAIAGRFDRVENADGQAAVLVRFLSGLTAADYWLPWSTLGPVWRDWAMVVRAPASLTREDAARIGAPVVGLDWVSVVGVVVGEQATPDRKVRGVRAVRSTS